MKGTTNSLPDTQEIKDLRTKSDDGHYCPKCDILQDTLCCINCSQELSYNSDYPTLKRQIVANVVRNIYLERIKYEM